MANINVECPHCQTNLESPDTLIGNEVQCPSCGKSFVVTPPQEGKKSAASDMDFQDRTWTDRSFFHLPVSPSLLNRCLIGLALVLSIVSLFIACSVSGMPKQKFETDPEKAVRAQVTLEKEYNDIMGNYFWRKNGGKILKSLEIKEIKVNGSWAVAFYKLSLGATEVKKTMMLYKVNEGYWMKISMGDARKKCPENWFRDMSEKMERFERDSGEFDVLDI